MSERTETVLHWAAAVNILMLGLLAIFPESWHGGHSIGAPWSYVFGAALGVTVAGFHFRMLFECVRGQWTVVRVLWLLFLLLLPIASAVIYFLFTRSRSFHSLVVPAAPSR